MERYTFEEKYKGIMGYFKNHDGLRVPEIPYFDKQFIESQRVKYTIDLEANHFCTAEDYWMELEQLYLDEKLAEADEKEKERISELIDDGDAAFNWGYRLDYPSGFELSVEDILIRKGTDPKIIEEGLGKFRARAVNYEDISKILEEKEGYDIQTPCREWLENKLKEHEMWEKPLTQDTITEYNNLINNFIEHIQYQTALAILQISDTSKDDLKKRISKLTEIGEEIALRITGATDDPETDELEETYQNLFIETVNLYGK